METDTIAAIATAMSPAGIGIIRVSGEDAVKIVHPLFHDKAGRHVLSDYAAGTIHYGFLQDHEQVLDEVMVSVMKAPASYTAEDTVEINCHGGILVMQKILDAVLKNGARLAEPGEFTKRAFLNGRIDLTEAEAVMDVIGSQSEYALRGSVSRLQGRLADEIHALREEILHELAFIEAALDDPEHYSLDGYADILQEKLQNYMERLQRLIDSYEEGKLLRDGIHAVIVGKPNAGKSSFLNLLLGEDRAIVTDIPGTTRDTLEERVQIEGILLCLTDTAGIRDTGDPIEKIGVEKAKTALCDSDLVIYVADSSRPIDEDDRAIWPLLADKKVILLLNKSDLESKLTEQELIDALPADTKILRTSIPAQEGLQEFGDTLQEMFFHGEIFASNEVQIASLRHKEALRRAYESLREVEKSIAGHMEEDFFSIDLADACAALGEITGEQAREDLVDKIFAEFCMGK